MSRTIGVLAPLFPPAKLGGGPIRTLDALVTAAPDTFDLSVLTSDHDLGGRDLLSVTRGQWVPHNNAEVFYARTRSLAGLLQAFCALRSRRPEVLYINGFFDPRFSILVQLLWRVGFWGGARRLLAPRGEFGQRALGRHSPRKQAYVYLYRLLRLHRRLVWHASSDLEAADIRRVWGDSAQIVVRENDTLLPERARLPAARALDTDRTSLSLVFLGRLVALKGLHTALEALCGVGVPVHLDVYGPSEDRAYVERCRALVETLPGSVGVRLLGPIEPEAARDTLAAYDALLMPTAGENFGHVIAESLSVSCPVFCSPHTPWGDVLRDGGGEVLELVPETWTQAIQSQAKARPDERLAARLEAGRAYERWRARPAMPHVFELFAAQ